MLAVAEPLRVLARRERSGAMGRNRAGAEGAGGGAERVGQGCGRACLREREQMVKEVRLALHLRTATRRCGHVSPRPQRGDNQRTHRGGFDPAARYLDHLAHLRIVERLQVEDGEGALVLCAPDARRPTRHLVGVRVRVGLKVKVRVG